MADGSLKVIPYMQEDFIKVVEPVIKWLNDNVHPHHTVIITGTHAELLEGELSHVTEKFVKD